MGLGCQIDSTDVVRGFQKQTVGGPQVTRTDYKPTTMGLDGSVAQAGGAKPPSMPAPVPVKPVTPGEALSLAGLVQDPAAKPAPPPATVACPPAAAQPAGPGPGFLPTELQKLSHPAYRIEPPDILLIDTISMTPKPPYTIAPLDALQVRVAGTLPEQPIDGVFLVGPDGAINLGYSYGLVRVAGLNVEQAQEEIRKQVSKVLKEPQVAVGLAQFRGLQQARGEHLVRPDGTISLGSYGSVYVTGLTLAQAKLAIERHLSQFVLNPQISLDVYAYNSKVFYIIADGAGYGELVYRFPATGNETVLDALSLIAGLPAVASPHCSKIWVARPSPADNCCTQVLPVDWRAITQGGSTGTNYQIFPGDRIYVKADPLVAFDFAVAKVTAPLTRILNVALLGGATVQTFRNNNNNNNSAAAIVVP
jgi:polysaccharide export outer membrane protein